MATQPAPVLSSPSTGPHVIPAFLQHWITFVKAHERLILVGIGALLLFHFYSLGINAWVNHDKIHAAASAAAAKESDAKTAALEQEVAQLRAEVDQRNAQIQQQIAANQTATQKQQQADAKLSADDLAARIAKLINVPATEITNSPVPNKLEINQDAAVTAAQQLELVPELQTEVLGLQTIIKNNNEIISKQTETIAQLNDNLTKEKKSHADDVALLKAQNHKSWLNGFKWGVITGVTLGLVAHHAGV